MKKKSYWNRDMNGQVLVLVALSIFVLVGIAALAVDGGNVYATRRKMQNAADAGALAGAHQLCFVDDDEDLVRNIAIEYAQDNSAMGADVEIEEDWIVTVVATTTTDTFFAGVIGWQEVDVAASASAKCTQAEVGDNIFPLTAEVNAYEDLFCDVTTGEGSYFYAFVSDTAGQLFYCHDDAKEDPPGYLICDCDVDYPFVGPDGTTVTAEIGPAERGWLALFEPTAPWEPVPGGHYGDNCTDLDYWIRYSHPGPINLIDDLCLPGKTGVLANLQSPITDVANSDNPIRNLVLYDNRCDTCYLPVETHDDCCSNDSSTEEYYHIVGLGCVKIIEYTTINLENYYEDGYCKQNVKVVVLQKRCGPECDATISSGTGDPDPDAVRSVTLIR